MSTISKFKKVKMFGIPFFLKEFLLINVLIGVYVVFCSNEEEKLRKPEREKKKRSQKARGTLSHKEFLLILKSQGGQDEYSV